MFMSAQSYWGDTIFLSQRGLNLSKELQNFNAAMGAILRADPKAVREQMDAQKRLNAEKRKAKKASASVRASNAKGG